MFSCCVMKWRCIDFGSCRHNFARYKVFCLECSVTFKIKLSEIKNVDKIDNKKKKHIILA